MQFDEGGRGFSLMRDGPLDMRMDRSSPLTAYEVINFWSERELGKVFREYGEERQWKKAARAVVEARRKKRIETTKELADIVSKTTHRGRPKLHPATLIFQALRICINGELTAIEEGLKKALRCLSPGGRIGVLSFHSLEDRIVKGIFTAAAKPLFSLSGGKEREALVKMIRKKPLRPKEEECKKNPRARSAKFRSCIRW